MIQTHELLILMMVWYSPPLLVASVIQAIMWQRINLFNLNKRLIIGAFVINLITPPFIGYWALQFSIPQWLAVSSNMLFMPMAFFIVVLVVAITCSFVFVLSKRQPPNKLL